MKPQEKAAVRQPPGMKQPHATPTQKYSSAAAAAAAAPLNNRTRFRFLGYAIQLPPRSLRKVAGGQVSCATDIMCVVYTYAEPRRPDRVYIPITLCWKNLEDFKGTSLQQISYTSYTLLQRKNYTCRKVKVQKQFHVNIKFNLLFKSY